MARTFLQSEEFAYPNGGQTRKGTAIYPDGRIRRVWAGIPDTYFSIPAHGRIAGKYLGGFLTIDDSHDSPNYGEFLFHPFKRYRDDANDCRYCGIVPSYGHKEGCPYA
jgi:hypothetical protein